VHKAAAGFVKRMGALAIPNLELRAELAADIGDTASATAWLDIAVAARLLL
jgi:hypothetical protein